MKNYVFMGFFVSLKRVTQREDHIIKKLDQKWNG